MMAGMPIPPLARKLMVALRISPIHGPRYHPHANALMRSRILLLHGPDDLQVSAMRLVCTFA